MAKYVDSQYGHKLVLFEDRHRAIGGRSFRREIAESVESYDPSSDSWQVEVPLSIPRNYGDRMGCKW